MPAAVATVAILHWPEDAGVVAFLRESGRPRLFLVAPDAAPPPLTGWDEDWIRLPARDDDLRARADALDARVARQESRPTLGDDGRLFYRGRWVSLSPTEGAMLAVMVDNFGAVVDVADLAGCSDPPISPPAVRVHLTRLRKRIAPMGLLVRSLRGRGYVLDVS